MELLFGVLVLRIVAKRTIPFEPSLLHAPVMVLLVRLLSMPDVADMTPNAFRPVRTCSKLPEMSAGRVRRRRVDSLWTHRRSLNPPC